MGEPNLSRSNDARHLSFEGCALCPTGIAFPDSMPFERWDRLGLRLQLMDAAVQWWIADWLAYCEKKYGESYTQAEAVTGLEYQTLANYRYVAGKVEFSRRRENLSFAHHAEVASLPERDQERLLDQAEPLDDDPRSMPRLSTRDLRERVKAIRQAKPLFVRAEEEAKIQRWLESQRETWPEKERPEFIKALEVIVERLAGS